MRSCGVAAAILAGLFVSLPVEVAAQDAGNNPPKAPTPASPQNQLPPVEVIQKKAAEPKAAQKKTAPKKTPAPVAAAPAPAPVAPPPLALEPAAGSNAGLVKISPLPGSEVPIAKIPRGVSTINSKDIVQDGSVIPQEILNNRIPAVVVDDLQGNQFQTGVQYRGFEASPVNGLPQGLAVYQNGVRINEAFGDTVNWDFLPSNAIDGIAVMGSNPVFGLNAIGGSISLTMKDGFTFQGADVDARYGSFGRKQVSTEAGVQVGNWAAYGAFEAINDDGFRDFSFAQERRGYADLGVKGDGAEFHFNFTGATGEVGVTAAVPEELLSFGGRTRTFTSPQITDNEMEMYSFNGVVQATPTLAFSGVTYYRHFEQSHIDGNISEFGPCAAGLCTEDGAPLYAVGAIGVPIDPSLYGTLGSIDKTGQDANSWGVALQAADKSRLFGLKNQFVVGASYDHGNVAYRASSQLGTFLPKYVVAGTGPTLTGDTTLPANDPLNGSDVTPRSLTTLNDYIGVYAVDTLDLTDRLAVTLGGRFNHARIEIENTGEPSLDALNGVNTYERFNPSAGLTYKLLPGISAYGGYSEANRAATASEIACSDPENPCIIESALASDPPLRQVVSKTWETGLRGHMASLRGTETLDWSAGLFRTFNSDDIIQIADSQQGRGYFANAGDTLRQGLELGATYRAQRWMAYASYSYVDATFQSTNVIPAENNPQVTTSCNSLGIPLADPGDNCLVIRPGDRMPGIPRHRFKAGFDYKLTPKWVFGADLISASDQFFYGDEANLDKPLPGYTKVNLHSSYDITDHVQVYGLIENLFDEQYGIYGTYFNTGLAQTAGPGAGGSGGPDPSLRGLVYSDSNGRTITPALPFSIYGGMKVKY
jgi:iron complex outermembrane receptor protein